MMKLTLSLYLMTLLLSTTAYSQQFTNDQKHLFNKMARGLVWCYEATGSIASVYDETGACGGSSIWLNQSDNESVVSEIWSFEPMRGYDALGTYQGLVRFKSPDNEDCRFFPIMEATDEDVLVKVVNFKCNPRPGQETGAPRCTEAVTNKAHELTQREEGNGPSVFQVKYLGKQEAKERTSGDPAVYEAYFVRSSTDVYFFDWIFVANALGGCTINHFNQIDRYHFD